MRHKVGASMYDQSQLMRGTLEGCILQIIRQEETYGYEIAARLEQFGFRGAKEGTLYPLLVRLEKKGMITATFRPSPLGPSRKYYSISPAGMQLLQEFRESWAEVSAAVEKVLSINDTERSVPHGE